MAPVLALTLQAYPDDVRLVYRHFPRIVTDLEILATQAIEAATLQDENLDMREHLIGSLDQWSQLSIDDFKTWMIEQAAELGLDSTKFAEDLTSDEIVARVGQLLHDKSALASQAAEAAALQVEFWTMHEHLYAAADEWVDLSPEDFESWLVEQAADLGLDSEQFTTDLTSEAIIEKVQGDFDEAVETGIPYTPFVFVNGKILPDFIEDGNDLILWLEMAEIPLAQLSEQQFSECPPTVIDPGKEYVATLHTEKGEIVIALYPEIAPFAVNNFVFLAQNDWYDNVSFHRVLEDFMAQGGDPSGTGMGNPGYLFSIEVNPSLKFDRPGLIAMANAGPTANGSQFFITYGPTEHLDGQFTIFGEVIQGMDVAESLTLRDPQADPFADPGDLILDVTIEEK